MHPQRQSIRHFIITTAAVVLGFAGAVIWNVAPLAAAGSPELTVSTADLSKAGFTAPAIQPTVPPNGYLAPNTYFRVKESVASTHPEWGGAANLVSVLIIPADVAWVYNQGNLDVYDLAGRTQIRLSRTGYYIVVTGPDKNKVTALVNILRTK